MTSRSMIPRPWLLALLLLTGCKPDPLVRYTDCVTDAEDVHTMTCRRIGTEFYRDFQCQPDGRCETSGAGNHPTIFMEEAP